MLRYFGTSLKQVFLIHVMSKFYTFYLPSSEADRRSFVVVMFINSVMFESVCCCHQNVIDSAT